MWLTPIVRAVLRLLASVSVRYRPYTNGYSTREPSTTITGAIIAYAYQYFWKLCLRRPPNPGRGARSPWRLPVARSMATVMFDTFWGVLRPGKFYGSEKWQKVSNMTVAIDRAT